MQLLGANAPVDLARASPPIQTEGETSLLGSIQAYATLNGAYWGTPGTSRSLESGFYAPGADQRGAVLSKMSMKTDNLLRLPDPTCDMLLREFVDFWEASPKMVARGLSPKRGLMLYGPPGSGKTSAVQLMSHHMVEVMNGIVIVASDPYTTAACLQLFRKIEPDRPLIVLYEDIDALVSSYGEPGYLALLDGELQISGVVNVATTNYPERLDVRFTDRPGRFDRIALVGMPEAPARMAYFKAKAPELPEPKLEQWVIASDGWSIAHLRELVVAHLVLGEDDADVIDRLTNMHDQLPKSDDHRTGGIGFGNFAAAKQNIARVGGRRG